MTRIEFVCSDEKAVALLRAERFFDEGVDVAPVRRGKWIPVDGNAPCDEWDCTNCEGRRTFDVDMDKDDMRRGYPYCPNCGAKMEVE